LSKQDIELPQRSAPEQATLLKVAIQSELQEHPYSLTQMQRL